MAAEAAYLRCRRIPVDYHPGQDIQELWQKHREALTGEPAEEVPHRSLLDLKITLAERVYGQCHFCERRCGINRERERGWCGVGPAAIASEFLHYGEEPMLIPSHTVFFSGCTFACVFCQNWDISQRHTGMHISPEHLVQAIHRRQGINVNWVGGDPTPNLPYILRVLRLLDTDVPQIWNSNMYCSQEAMHLLHGVMDVYLTDFKYGNDECARRLSHVDHYWEVVTRNHTMAAVQGQVLIRHLVMPNHVDCCSLPVMEWIAANVPGATVNVMDQYRPCYQASEHPDLNRCITWEEHRRVVEHARSLGLRLLDDQA